MTFRDAVIRIVSPLDEINYILWNQPWHNKGLAFDFSFTKAYGVPAGTCDMTVYNINEKIVSYFDFLNYDERPKIEIFAGHLDKSVVDYENIDSVISRLPLVFSGYPFWVSDKKVVGERFLEVQLSDLRLQLKNKTDARTSDYFPKGITYGTIIDRWLTRLNFNAEYDKSVFHALAQKLEYPLAYAGANILYNALPALCRKLNIGYRVESTGKLVFVHLENAVEPKTTVLVTENTGLIEYPTKVNWTHYQFSTFYGLPQVMNVGEWVEVSCEYFQRSKINKIVGMIINTEHAWNDSDASITYTISLEGTPVSSRPITPL